MATVPKTVTDIPGSGNETLVDVEAHIFLDGDMAQVDPDMIRVEIGHTVTWHLPELPAGDFIQLVFPDFPDPAIGPFSSLTLSASLITGVDYGHNNPNNAVMHCGLEVRYDVGLIRGEEPIWNHDPLIDTLGDPPHPMEES